MAPTFTSINHTTAGPSTSPSPGGVGFSPEINSTLVMLGLIFIFIIIFAFLATCHACLRMIFVFSRVGFQDCEAPEQNTDGDEEMEVEIDGEESDLESEGERQPLISKPSKP